MFRYCIGMVLLLTIFITNTYGFEQTSISANYGSFMKLDISGKGINRINFGSRRIDKIIGDNSEFTAVVSENGENLFLTSKVGAGSNINMSVQFLDGKTMDMTIRVVERKLPSLIELNSRQDSALDSSSEEAKSMLMAMVTGRGGKYYVQDVDSRFNLPNNSQIEFRQESSYRYGNLSGGVYVVTNRSRLGRGRKASGKVSNVHLDSRMLAGLFSGSMIAAVENEMLPAGEQTRAYVVVKRGRGGDSSDV